MASFESVLSRNASAVAADFIRTCTEKRGPSMLEAVLVYQMIKGILSSAFMSFAAHYGNWVAAVHSFIMNVERASLALSTARTSVALKSEHMLYTAALTASLYTRDFHNFLFRFVRELSNGSADA